MSVASSQPSDPNSSGPSVAGVRRQADRLADFVHRPAGDGARSLAPAFEDGVDLLAAQLGAPLAERSEALDDALGEDPLLLLATDLRLSAQVPVVLPIVEEEFVERAHVARARVARLRFVDAFGVGHHAHDLLANHVRWVCDSDDVLEALRHLRLAVGALDDGRVGIEHDLGFWKDRAVSAVESSSDLARELDMRSLVATHRHDVALDDDDVGALQHRVLE